MKVIESVSVVGSGFMGWQISLQCALHGIPVNIYDISQSALRRAIADISQELEARVDKGQMTPDKKNKTFNFVNETANLKAAAADVDLVIEAVPERLDLKREVFKELDHLCRSDTILSTNSSSIRVSRIEDATSRPALVLNTHFFSNPWSSRIVELMKGTSTSDETMEYVRQFMYVINMTPLTVLKESTGFIFNRVWRAVKREALHLVDEGVASFEDVDRAWMSLYKTGIGPFGMMDRIGLDVVRDIEMVYYVESGNESDAPPRLLVDKIRRGELGVKTGKGFYTYPDPAFMRPSWLNNSSVDVDPGS